jgi:hypothetical protein
VAFYGTARACSRERAAGLRKAGCHLRCLYRFHYGQEISRSPSEVPRAYSMPAPFNYGRLRRRLPIGLRLKQAHRVMVPLSAEEVALFWNSFRTFRDLPTRTGDSLFRQMSLRDKDKPARSDRGPALEAQ